MDQNAKGKSEESCDCFLGPRTICGSAYKLFMAAYCCSTPTFWLLTHLQPSPAHLSLFKPKQPPHPLPPPPFFAHPVTQHTSSFLFPSSPDLTFVPQAKRRLASLHPARQRATSKLSSIFFLSPVCLSPSVCIFSPLPHTSSSADTALMCAFGKGGWGWWVGVGGFKKRRAGLGVGWGVTSHNHQSERYQGQLS